MNLGSMSTTYRLLQPGDFDRYIEVVATGFAVDPKDRGRMAERYRRDYQDDWTVAAEVDGAVQASVTTLPYEMLIEGATIKLGAVTSVACVPEHRRQGHVAALLRQALELMRERGQPLGGLYTPHNALYRRYGWENCSEWSHYEFRSKDVHLRDNSPVAGRVIRADVERWQDFDAVYRRYANPRNGELTRNETMWRHRFRGGWDNRIPQSFLFESAEGSLDGLLMLDEKSTNSPEGTKVNVQQLVALTGDALRGLLQIVLSFDLAGKVALWVALDEPLYDVLGDPLPRERRGGWHHLLRIVDLKEAFEARPCYEEGSIVIDVSDRDCPWNEGSWRIDARGGRFEVNRTDQPASVDLDTNALAQVFSGYRKLSELARIGRAEVRVEDPQAVDDLFRTRYRPFTSDDY